MTAEQFIKDHTNHCSNELTDGGFHEWLTPEQALRAVEIAKDIFIEKSCEWFRKGGDGWYLTSEFGEDTVDFIKLEEDFKKLYEKKMNYD